MDDRLRRRVVELARQLAAEEHERLAALGTFADFESAEQNVPRTARGRKILAVD